jgi:AraC-like DNA-binding protein
VDGSFELRDAAARRVIDPSVLLALPAGHDITIRHPSGPDTCLSFSGAVVDSIAAEGARTIAPSAAAHARLLAQIAAFRRGEGDELGLAEALCAAAEGPRARSSPRPWERALAGELRLRHALALLVDGSAPLADVAAQAGFASQSHLTNRFRERFGVTPREARMGLRALLAAPPTPSPSRRRRSLG